MTDRDIIQRLASYWGVRVGQQKKAPPRKVLYSAVIAGSKAIGWMFTLYPWLGDRRRARIREIVAEWKSAPRHSMYRTHCPAGHEYAGHNLLVSPREGTASGVRRCRECHKLRAREARRALKEAV